MDGDTLYTIGELARRTGLPVRTIRFYSDSGVVPPTDRSPAGYRLYDIAAATRLDLVRTLRDLGIDLDTVRRVLTREVTVGDVAATHAEALDAQIRTLRLRRAVLRAVAKRGSAPEEVQLMHKLAKLSDEERNRIITGFVDETFAGLEVHPEFAAKMRAALPELPDDPSPEQVDAWVELAELVGDPDFRAAVRRMAEFQSEESARGAAREGGQDSGQELTAVTVERVSAAINDGVDPASDAARPVVDALAAAYAGAFGEQDGPDFRARLLHRLEVGGDRRAERYWQLLAVINGWPVPPSLVPVFEWFIAALRH